MPVVEATSTELVIRLTLQRQSDGVTAQTLAEVGEDAPVFPYGIRTRVEVDGKPVAMLSRLSFEADSRRGSPTVEADVSLGLSPEDWGRLSERARASIRQTVEALRGFRVFAVRSCLPEDNPPSAPIAPTQWEWLENDPLG